MPKIKCQICGEKKINKIMIDMFTCKCSKITCTTCKETHICSFDYKKEFTDSVMLSFGKSPVKNGNMDDRL